MNCPKCGAEPVHSYGGGTWYACGTYIDDVNRNCDSQDNYCKERESHAETRRKLETLQKWADGLDVLTQNDGDNREYVCGDIGHVYPGMAVYYGEKKPTI